MGETQGNAEDVAGLMRGRRTRGGRMVRTTTVDRGTLAMFVGGEDDLAADSLSIFRDPRTPNDEMPRSARVFVDGMLTARDQAFSGKNDIGGAAFAESRLSLRAEDMQLYLVPTTGGRVCFVLREGDGSGEVSAGCDRATKADVTIHVSSLGNDRVAVFGIRRDNVGSVSIDALPLSERAKLGRNSFLVLSDRADLPAAFNLVVTTPQGETHLQVNAG